MKKCSRCKNEYSLDNFYSNLQSKDGKHSFCKQCFLKASKLSYKKYHSKRIITAKKYRIKNRAEILEKLHNSKNEKRKFIIDYLLEHPCVDCGETDPIVLEFDHVIGTKKWNISSLIKTRATIEILKEELEKCEVRCANCHRRKTIKNSYKNLFNIIQ